MKPYSVNELIQWICLEYNNHKTIFGIRESDFFINNSTFYCGFHASSATLQSQNIITAFLTGANAFTVDLPETTSYERDSVFFDEYIKAWILIHIVSSLFLKKGEEIKSPFFLLSFSSQLTELVNLNCNSLLSWFLDIRLYRKFKFYFDSVSYELNHGIFNKVFNIGPSDSDAILNSLKFRMADSLLLPFGKPSVKGKYGELIFFARQNQLHTWFYLHNTELSRKVVESYIDAFVFNIDDRNKLPQFNFLYYMAFPSHVKGEESSIIKPPENDISDALSYLQSICREHGNNFKLVFYLDKTTHDAFFCYESLFYLLHTIPINSIKTDLTVYSDGNFEFGSILYSSGIRNFLFGEKLLSVGGFRKMTQYARLINESNSTVPSEDTVFRKNLHIPCLFHFHENIPDASSNDALKKSIPMFDCFVAPCKKTCPINQDISAYVWFLEKGMYEDAFKVIHSTNPLPYATSYLCEEPCKNGCIRKNIDKAVRIKNLKYSAMFHHSKKNKATMMEEVKNNSKTETVQKKVAVIGSGPTGLSCAYACAKRGWDVSVFEMRKKLGGSLSKYVPEFEMPYNALSADIAVLRKMGVKFNTSSHVDDINDLIKSGFDFVFLAIGRQLKRKMNYAIPDDIILDAVDFIDNDEKASLMLKKRNIKHVCVIGDSRSAITAARTASRLKNVKQVFVISRNDIPNLNLSADYIKNDSEDNIQFLYYFEPEIWEYNMLVCKRISRNKKIFVNSDKPDENDFYTIPCDIVINATGMDQDKSLLDASNITFTNEKNNKTYRTNHPSVFIGGSYCNEQLSIIESIADGINAAHFIFYTVKENENLKTKEAYSRNSLQFDETFDNEIIHESVLSRKVIQQIPLFRSSFEESMRCCHCDKVCGICSDVCPNRANIQIKNSNPALKNIFQIVHIDRMCTLCNKCVDFCPYNGIPYNDKFIIYHEREKFDKSNKSSLFIDKINSKIILRDFKEIKEYQLHSFFDNAKKVLGKKRVLSNSEHLVLSIIDKYSYIF